MTHSFTDSLRWSEGIARASDYEAFYRAHFPDLVQAIPVVSGGNVYQRQGIDRILLLANGKQLTVDEKVRSKDYGDWDELWRGIRLAASCGSAKIVDPARPQLVLFPRGAA